MVLKFIFHKESTLYVQQVMQALNTYYAIPKY